MNEHTLDFGFWQLCAYKSVPLLGEPNLSSGSISSSRLASASEECNIAVLSETRTKTEGEITVRLSSKTYSKQLNDLLKTIQSWIIFMETHQ